MSDILVIYDVTAKCVKRLTNSTHQKFDLVIVVGPFTRDKRLLDQDFSVSTTEEMTEIIHLLEGISLKVIYLPSQDDYLSLRNGLCLTPNSINLSSKSFLAKDGLVITGFTETTKDEAVNSWSPNGRGCTGDDMVIDDAFGNGTSSIDRINKLFLFKDDCEQNFVQSVMANRPICIERGILLFDYKFIQTLNYLLFHVVHQVLLSNMKVLIVPPNTEEAFRLPTSFNGLKVIVPKSLKSEGKYYIVRLRKYGDANAEEIEYHTL
jgi:Icc-related predicted phosphoesterase